MGRGHSRAGGPGREVAGGLRLRRHQREALAALEAAWESGVTRSWVALPPGAGKTLVGLVTASRLIASGQITRAVALAPNNAILGQWLRGGIEVGLISSDGRDLAAELTAMTYQQIALFAPEADVDYEGIDEAGESFDTAAGPGGSLMSRLHPNGRSVVESLKAAGPILLILDECHHLLEVWGRLLVELLAELPEAVVLGLTATPPEVMTRSEAALVDELFGPIAYAASIPAVVRQGDLAPFADLVWVTEPTPLESAWLTESATRFSELTAYLMDPEFGSVPFLSWLDARFVVRSAPGGTSVGWGEVVAADPDLADAVLRLAHAGLLALPEGAVVHEQHRRPPTSEDWVRLIDDWVSGHLLAGPAVEARDQEADERALAAVREALPAVGYLLTRTGVRRSRSLVDRVLSRSESKMAAVVDIAAAEAAALGERMRLLVLCDHERAAATVPLTLDGVISPQAGSAHAAMRALLAAPESGDALLVTGASVAGSRETLGGLVDHIRRSEPRLAAALHPTQEPLPDGADRAACDDLWFLVSRGEGPAWSSRVWVPLVTRFFESGGTRILVGTRGLLGEGWDARRITGVVDLTTVTTTTSVVQTRGRALRVDPAHPDKVAVNWTVVTVAADHPRGDHDWQRLVRKHQGFFGAADDGAVVDGVAHIDAAFSPYRPPAPAEIAEINTRALLRAADRDRIRARWQVGAPYDDEVTRTVRLVPARASQAAGAAQPLRVDPAATPAVLVRPGGLEVVNLPSTRGERIASRGSAALAVVGVLAAVWGLASAVVDGTGAGSATGIGTALACALGAFAWSTAARVASGRRILAAAGVPPSLARVAAALADALHGTGRSSLGAEALEIEVDPPGAYRIRLAGVPEGESALFADALDEVVSPIASPRYVLPRWVLTERRRRWHELAALARGRKVQPDGQVWHAVPTALGARRADADAFADAWDRWVGGGRPERTSSPTGAGVLAAQRGADPFAVSSTIRRHWH